MTVTGLHRFDLATRPVTPWKNGGGTTQEIACGTAPDAAPGAFDWRVSVARIEADGPFSSFPGVARVIVLLDGAGVRLRSNDSGIDHWLDVPLVPWAFPGEAAITATCLGTDGLHASRDFNVMTRRAALRATVSVLRDTTDLPTCSHGLLLAVARSWALRGDTALDLTAGTGVWWQGPRHSWHARTASESDDAALIFVHWERVSP